jgi:hypothetical protein
VKQISLMMVLVRLLDHDRTAHDIVGILVQFVDALPDRIFDSRRWLHMPETDFQWYLHQSLPH